MYDILELNKKLLSELKVIAKELKIKRVDSYKKQDLIYQILRKEIALSSKKQSKLQRRSQQKNRKKKLRQTIQILKRNVLESV